jgi:hypothetical protein
MSDPSTPLPQNASSNIPSERVRIRPRVRLKPGSERPRYGWAWLRGILILGILVWLMGFSPLPWASLVGVWILGVILLDEVGGSWFAYLGIPVGWLAFLSVPEQWWTVAPLLTGCLWVYLLIRHSGGLFALPLAVAGFVTPWFVFQFLLPRIDRVGKVDPVFRLLTADPFPRVFIGTILMGAGFVLLYHLLVFVLGRAKVRRSLPARAVPIPTSAVPPVPAPSSPTPPNSQP